MIDSKLLFKRSVGPYTAQIRRTGINLPGKLDVAVGDGPDQKAVDDVFNRDLLLGQLVRELGPAQDDGLRYPMTDQTHLAPGTAGDDDTA